MTEARNLRVIKNSRPCENTYSFHRTGIRVEHYHLIKTQWVQTEFHTYKDVLPLVSIDCKLPLQGIYRRVPEVVS